MSSTWTVTATRLVRTGLSGVKTEKTKGECFHSADTMWSHDTLLFHDKYELKVLIVVAVGGPLQGVLEKFQTAHRH